MRLDTEAISVGVRLLGAVDVLVDGTPRLVPGVRRKATLAALALHPGEIVSVDRLVELVWEGHPPRGAVTSLRSHVSRLREVLSDRAAIRSLPPGYILELDGEVTDLQAAEHLIAHAQGSSDPREREALLASAVDLWRDNSLADIAELLSFKDAAGRLDGIRLRARRMLIDARLALGRHAELVAELEDLSYAHPLDEQIHAQLILALYRSGRQGDALGTYERLRRTLDEGLGIGPSRLLSDLHVAILRQDPSIDPPVTTSVHAASLHVLADTAPAQLPPPLRAFTGRVRESAALDSLLSGVRQKHTAPVVVAVSGTAGVGKTTFAVQWAHSAITEFPDGQLYLNLRGYDASGSPMEPADAVRHVLDSFGIPAERIPANVDSQVGLYRSLLADKKLLLVLDNARDADQIRPLLPSSPGCVVLVTSRDQLTPLAVSHGAQLLTLDPLSIQDAYELITRRVGANRATAEPDAMKQLISQCAGLPLALAITAARACAHPTFPLRDLAAQLYDTKAHLDRFHSSYQSTDLRAVFSWSYHALSPEAARLFRLFGIHPGPDIGTDAVANLAALPKDRTRILLTELAEAHLVTQHTPGRYTLHDLLRAFATELAHTHDTDQERRAATNRLLDHYLHNRQHRRQNAEPIWRFRLRRVRDRADSTTLQR